MTEQDTIAVIGAGIVGAAVAHALAREGRRVLLVDRAAPGIAGASFGNVGHIAAELVQPLPSPALLFGFWRQLFLFGGTLDLPARRALRMLPWISHFAAAAFRRAENTHHLAPLVLPAARVWERRLDEIGMPGLLRRNGHYEIEFGAHAESALRVQARDLMALGIKTRLLAADELLPLSRAARQKEACGLWFEDSAHIIDPLEAVRAFAAAAMAHGAEFLQTDVSGLRSRGRMIEILSDRAPVLAGGVVVCAGMGSAALLAPFGTHAPLQAIRGYHIELPGEAPMLDAPVVYKRAHTLVTPMAGRLRASSFMEFAPAAAPVDPRKPLQLRRRVRRLGYACELVGPSWVGARPVLPDYLPGIGRVTAAAPMKLYYALGHQHIGLTLAPITADLIADLVAERTPRLPIIGFDLRRFGSRVS